MGLFSRNSRHDYANNQGNYNDPDYNQGFNNNSNYNNNSNIHNTTHSGVTDGTNTHHGIHSNHNTLGTHTNLDNNTTNTHHGMHGNHNTLGTHNNLNDDTNTRHGIHSNQNTLGTHSNLNDGTNTHHGMHGNHNTLGAHNNLNNNTNSHHGIHDNRNSLGTHNNVNSGMGMGGRHGNRLGRHRNRHSEKPHREKRGLFDIHSGYYNRRPSFGTWLKYTWLDILTMVAMGAIGLGVYEADPAPTRSFPVTFSDGQIVYPQFAYPLRREIIPIWAAAMLGALVPIFIILCMQIRIRSFWDVNNGIIGLLYSLIGAAVFQVFVKWLIGGLRPHFLDVCRPDVSKLTAGGDGFLNIMFHSDICTGDRNQINDSLESMPSGHSTAAWAGFLYLYFYLNGKLKVFSNYHPAMWKLIALYAPLLGATLITGALTIDEFHNWYDCLAGAIIGSVFAISSYRMVYASVWDFRFNHIPLTRHTPFSYGAGPAGAAGFESCVFTHSAGWGYEEAFGGAPFDSAFGLRGGGGGGLGGGMPTNEHSIGLGHKNTGHRDGDLEHNAATTTGMSHSHGHHHDRNTHSHGLGHHNNNHLGRNNDIYDDKYDNNTGTGITGGTHTSGITGGTHTSGITGGTHTSGITGGTHTSGITGGTHTSGPTEGEFMREGRTSNISGDQNRYRTHRKSLERKAVTNRNEPAY